MIGLFDRDVFLKVGCCNLWNETLQALQIDQPMRLVSTSSMSSNRSVLKRWLSETSLPEAELRIEQLVENVPVVSDELTNSRDEDLMARLEGIEDIDSGEQLLVSILYAAPKERLLVSGDKRFLRALAELFPDVCEATRSSLFSFERCLVAVTAAHGFDYIAERCTNFCDCDGSLRLAFGSHPNEAAFSEALKSFDPLPDNDAANSV